MTSPLFIFGTGGQARDVADIAVALDYRPVFITHDPEIFERWNGLDELVLESHIAKRTQEVFAIGVGDNTLRSKIAEHYAESLNFINLIHPDTSFGRNQRERINEKSGVIVFAGARFTSNISVGNFCTFNLNTSVSHDCEIEDFVNISPNASIAGNVYIGNGAWIGMGATVNQGTDARKLQIGELTVIGSGAAVIGDCEPFSTYVGVPARKIR